MMLQVCALALAALTANAFQCGKPAVPPQLIDLNIIGGQEAEPKSFPWQAGMYMKPFFDIPPYDHGVHFCAGALIDNRTVLTAAHCLLSLSASETRIHLGAHKRNSKDDTEIYVNIEHFCPHPEYAGVTNDIGIVRLTEDIKFTDAISPICLPEPNEEVKADDKLYVTGWGYISAGPDAQSSEVLMQARQVQITKEQCLSMREMDVEKLICAIHTRGSTCHGDSGGPLQMKRGDLWQLQGVVSGGPAICGTPDAPMFYTEISKFMDWIDAYRASPSPKLDSNICR